MTRYTAEKLYELLPAIYRIRDSQQGEPLKALLAVIAEQMAVVEDDIARLHDNWFVETCEEWIAPYLGDLLGVRNLHPVSQTTFSQRAQVANTLSYRRRKGTATMLEQLARDTTGWNARAVEFFELLATTQCVNHIRLGNHRTPDLRIGDSLELLDSPFDTIAHTADVRRIALNRGRHNIPNVGLFLWRLQAYPLREVQPFSQGGGRFSFSPLGNDAPLFNPPQTEAEITHLAEEANVPGLLRRRVLYQELEALRQSLVDGEIPSATYFGTKPVLELQTGDPADVIPPSEILICNLANWDEPPNQKLYTRFDGIQVARAIRAAVDPVLGRIAFPGGTGSTRLRVSYAYGFSSDLGGGPYDRRLVLQGGVAGASSDEVVAVSEAAGTVIRVSEVSATPTLAAALAAWVPSQPRTVIQIDDNRIYSEDLTILMGGSELTIQSAPGFRPALAGDIAVNGGSGQSRLVLEGLLLAGQIRVARDLAELHMRHCTLVPGRTLDSDGDPAEPERPSVVVHASNDTLRLVVDRSVAGPLRLSPSMRELVVRDSIIDAPEPALLASPPAGPPLAVAGSGSDGSPAPATTLERTTVFGAVHVTQMQLASEVIFTAPVLADQRQSGCVRFSFVPGGSRVPRCHRCQPDLAIQLAVEAAQKENPALSSVEAGQIAAETRFRLRPVFTERRYGRPGYAQLGISCPVEIRTGAENEAEMGAFNHLQQSLREANLRTQLDEYLRFGLEAGIFFVT
jgi:Phage tail protein (Tail_P2_I)